MSKAKRGSLLPLTYVFGSFFGAAMIAAAFAYNNYRFSQFKFINFNEVILYEKSDIFVPDKPSYTLLFFSSNQKKLEQILPSLASDLPVLAVDIAQKKQDYQDIKVLRSDINTILKMLFALNISELPTALEIKKDKNQIYKQNSKLQKLKEI